MFLQAAQKDSEARRAKIDERRRTFLYVDVKSVKRNEAYESFFSSLLGPRMGLVIDCRQFIQIQVRVALGRRKAGMTEQFLNDPQIGAAV